MTKAKISGNLPTDNSSLQLRSVQSIVGQLLTCALCKENGALVGCSIKGRRSVFHLHVQFVSSDVWTTRILRDRLQRNEVLRLQEEFFLHAGGVSVLDHYWSSTEAALGPHWTPTGPVIFT
ncbi:hypothetical protein KIN20_013184 [Parelaphostrongylus tenuis]|uniref:Uncharacterized protein n=1 Tax=Parelaphostrongylus tenuis TaxID=148309 RepID=A0AAD5QNL7_PARTN|nr:hypothetical protein KIN20_013184 [Parelaphostrongylus tenuis]